MPQLAHAHAQAPQRAPHPGRRSTAGAAGRGAASAPWRDERPQALARQALAEQAGAGARAAAERLAGSTEPDQAEKPVADVVDDPEGPDALDALGEAPARLGWSAGSLRVGPGAARPGGLSERSAAVFGAGGMAVVSGVGAGRSGRAPRREVAPTTRVDMNAAGSTCLPDDITTADVDWQVVDDGKKWRAEATQLRTAGQINVNPTPNLPTVMTTPNTANPVVNGNLNNSKDSANHWKFAIQQMQAYHTRGHGRSAHWHATAASLAHEQAHWDTDWLKNVLGPRWPAARKAIAGISIPKKDAADAAAARPLLEDKVNAKITKLDQQATRAWNAVPDSPGALFANGYKAGERVLAGLIGQVRSFGKAQKW